MRFPSTLGPQVGRALLPDSLARNDQTIHRDPGSDLIDMTFAQKLSRPDDSVRGSTA
jgi:hypothetical protein